MVSQSSDLTSAMRTAAGCSKCGGAIVFSVLLSCYTCVFIIHRAIKATALCARVKYCLSEVLGTEEAQNSESTANNGVIYLNNLKGHTIM